MPDNALNRERNTAALFSAAPWLNHYHEKIISKKIEVR